MITIQRDQLLERGIDTKRGRGSLDKLHILIRQHINKSSAIFVEIFFITRLLEQQLLCDRKGKQGWPRLCCTKDNK